MSETYDPTFDPAPTPPECDAFAQPTDIDPVVGPGHDLDSLWRDQGDTNYYCALYSVRGIVSELEDRDVDVEEVLDRAFQNNWRAALDADHAVAVTGVDHERGVVIMNDSARGPGPEVPLDTFFESWRDRNFQMTLTDGAAPGIALLGLTLHPRFA